MGRGEGGGVTTGCGGTSGKMNSGGQGGGSRVLGGEAQGRGEMGRGGAGGEGPWR